MHNFAREDALAIMDSLTALQINVAVIAIADPAYAAGEIDDEQQEPLFQIELSRNSNIDATKVSEIADALAGHEATVQFPSMQVVSTKPEPEPEPDPTSADAEVPQDVAPSAENPQNAAETVDAGNNTPEKG